jgi:uncharacterized protein YjbJ (UPF0337 family)
MMTAAKPRSYCDRMAFAPRTNPATKDTMNADQIQGNATELAGKVQEVVGKATGNKTMHLKGLHNQVTGSAEAAIAEAKQGLKNVGQAIEHAVKAS